jgi:hypothetical protein
MTDVGTLLVFDDERVVLLCRAFRKPGGKSQQADDEQISAARKLLARYEQARAAGEIEYDEE